MTADDPAAAWGVPLDAPRQPGIGLPGVAVEVARYAAPGALLGEVDAAARRAVRKHLDKLATQALADALADAGSGDQLRLDTADALALVIDGTPAPDAPPPPPEPMFANVADWLHAYLLPNYRRPLLHNRWCQRWWEHAEAISRLEAIWQAWEAMRYDGATGLAVWWRDYADPHLRVLLDEAGPFFDCDAARDQHKLPDSLPVELPPAGLFRDTDHPEEQPASPPAAAQDAGRAAPDRREEATS